MNCTVSRRISQIPGSTGCVDSECVGMLGERVLVSCVEMSVLCADVGAGLSGCAGISANVHRTSCSCVCVRPSMIHHASTTKLISTQQTHTRAIHLAC